MLCGQTGVEKVQQQMCLVVAAYVVAILSQIYRVSKKKDGVANQQYFKNGAII